MGGGGKGGGGSNPAADAQARIAEQMFAQTDPIRTSLINRSATFLGAPTVESGAAVKPTGGGKSDGPLAQALGVNKNQTQVVPGGGGTPMGFGDVVGTPTYSAFRDSTDQTFRAARNNAMARLPGGGALIEALADLEGQKASTLTQGAGQIYESELARAMSLATGQASSAMGGLGQAALAQAQAAAAEAQQGAAKAGGLGTAVGGLAGFMMGGPAGAAAGAAIGGGAGTAAGS